MRTGGAGIRKLAWVAESAFAGAVVQSARHIATHCGFDFAPESDPLATDFRLAASMLSDRYDGGWAVGASCAVGV